MLINNTIVCLDGTAFCILYVWMRSPYACGSNLARLVNIEIVGKLDVDVHLHPHKNERIPSATYSNMALDNP
jgi:hypothetical protein